MKMSNDINQEISEATYEKPITLLEKEKEHLKPLPSADMIAIYRDDLIERKVSKEAIFH